MPQNTPNPDQGELHKAKASPQTRLSPIWIVPLVAVIIGLWLVYDNSSSRGTLVTLTMESAEGIEAGSTLIRSRNVEIGRVQSVRLSDDLSHAVMVARISGVSASQKFQTGNNAAVTSTSSAPGSGASRPSSNSSPSSFSSSFFSSS